MSSTILNRPADDKADTVAPEWLSTRDVAAIAQVSIACVCAAAVAGRLRGQRVPHGNSWRFMLSDATAWAGSLHRGPLAGTTCRRCDNELPLWYSYTNDTCCNCRAAEHKAYINSIKMRGCVDCGYAQNPDGLVFHHRVPAEKIADVSTLARRSRDVIDTEMAKCDVLCGTCHLLRHAKMRKE